MTEGRKRFGRIVTLKLPESLLARLDEHCREYGITRSEVIRQAIINLLRHRAQYGQLRSKYFRATVEKAGDAVEVEIAPIWSPQGSPALRFSFRESETDEVLRDLLHLLAKIRKTVG